METKSFFTVSDVNILKSIQKDLNEDPERLERQVQLFREWLKCEPHLPKDIDDQFVFNFLRYCKGNLDKAKRKFENYLAARTKWRSFFPDITFDDKYFAEDESYRLMAVHPKLTPDGYRLCIYRVPTIDQYNVERILHYGLTLMELAFFYNISSGMIYFLDAGSFTAQHIARGNLKLIMSWTNMVMNMYPMRIKNIHIINLPKVAETLCNVLLKVLSEKLSKRVIIHKNVEEISKYIPLDILIDEYGGKGEKFEKHTDQMKQFLINNNKDLKGKLESLKLAGPIPSNKSNLYSFDEDFGMEGSFRKLNID